jgi:hypothetical protein
MFQNMVIFKVRICYHLAQPSSWRSTHCRLSATAYSIYSQLPSTPGGRSSIRNHWTCHTVVTETHLSLLLLSLFLSNCAFVVQQALIKIFNYTARRVNFVERILFFSGILRLSRIVPVQNVTIPADRFLFYWRDTENTYKCLRTRVLRDLAGEK